jgi:phosphatidylglycerophosphate synthase
VITEAALYLATSDDARSALVAVAGRPLAYRMLVAALRAGCRRVYVPSALRAAPLDAALSTSPAARAAVVWLGPDTPPAAGPLLLLPAAALVPTGALAPLVAAPAGAVLAAARDSDAPVAALTPALARPLWPALAAGRPLGEPLERALKGEAGAAVAEGGWYVRVTSARGVTEAEARLDADLGSPVDSRLDTLFHRRLSHPVSRLAVRWGIAPNAVTLASFVVGLVAVWCFWEASPGRALAGLVLYAAAVVLDHADGEVARLALKESSSGAWLDVVGDTAIHALLLVALGVTAQRAAGGGAVAGVVAALGAAGSAVLAQNPPTAAGGVGALLDALSNRDGFYVMLVGFILGLAFAPALLPGFMILVAAGCHAFWLSRLAYRLARRGSGTGSALSGG